jgi:glucokinase-like ROK family protein
MSKSIDALQSKLIASCQASMGEPLEDVDTLRRIAMACLAGGAGGLRLNSAKCVAAVRSHTRLPIIGIEKVDFGDRVRITPDFAAAARLARAGADIIALDCTDREWPGGEPWRQLIDRIHRELHLPVMADIATLEEALAAATAGADMIGTTLSGYTDETRDIHSFNWTLLAALTRQTGRPIVAEGRISSPRDARRAIAARAWCVVVGAAITRPGSITAGFVREMSMPLNQRPAIAADIGATAIKAGLVDREGRIEWPVRVPTPFKQGAEAIASSAAGAIEQVLHRARCEGIEPVGVGIASAGFIDTRAGSVFAATDNLPGWSGFNLREFAEKRFHLPTCVENDAHAAALGELTFGSGRDLHTFVSITLGTGVGGAVVIDRELIRGQHGFAGAFGHSPIRAKGRPCNCGLTGCLEAYVSAAALVLEYKKLDGAAALQSGGEDAALAFEVGRLADAQDRTALQAYSTLAGYLAEGIANLFNILDPQAVLVSGGLVKGRPDFIADVERRVSQLLYFGAQRKPRVLLATGGDQSGVLGAAAALFDYEARHV